MECLPGGNMHSRLRERGAPYNEKLAASFGMTCADFEDIPVTVDACNVAYDALAESRSGLIPYADADKRRNEWLNDDGSFNQPRFLTGLAKSRFTVIIAWFIFGKGNFVWVLHHHRFF